MNKSILLFFESLFLILCITTTPLVGVNWIGPVNVFTTEIIDNPVVGVDGIGNAVILATASDDLSNYYEVGAQLIQGVPQNLHKYFPTGTNTNSNNGFNSIAVNASGNAAALWLENNDFNAVTVGSILTNNSWNSSSVLSSNTGTQNVIVDGIGVTLDTSNVAIAAWSSDDSFPPLRLSVQISQYVPPNWLPYQDIISGDPDARSGVSMSGSPSGQAMIVQVETNGSTNSIFGSYYDGVSWSTQFISSDVQDACSAITAVSMNVANQAMILWCNSLSSEINSSYFSSGTFGSVQTVYTRAGTESIDEFVVALDNSGNAIALWTTSDDSFVYKVMGNRSSGGTWGTPFVLDTADSSSSLAVPNIGVDGQGNGYAVWEKNDTLNEGTIYFSEYTQSIGTWSTSPTMLSSPGVSSYSPNLSVNTSGNATVVWHTGLPPVLLLSITSQTLQAVYTDNQIPLPVQNLSGRQIKNKFLTQTDLINELNWSVTSTSSIVSYIIKRNGIQIAVVPVGVLSYQDHNRRKGVPNTYQVIVVSTNGLQSVPTTIVIP